MATHYGQAAILTPSDYFFARDGIAAEGTVNQEQMVLSDVDLNLLDEQRLNGTVLHLNDLIRDAYDRVIHCIDRGDQVKSAVLALVAGGVARKSSRSWSFSRSGFQKSKSKNFCRGGVPCRPEEVKCTALGGAHRDRSLSPLR
jgi:hypothetical protein